jgi:hypothetical protein
MAAAAAGVACMPSPYVLVCAGPTHYLVTFIWPSFMLAVVPTRSCSFGLIHVCFEYIVSIHTNTICICACPPFSPFVCACSFVPVQPATWSLHLAFVCAGRRSCSFGLVHVCIKYIVSIHTNAICMCLPTFLSIHLCLLICVLICAGPCYLVTLIWPSFMLVWARLSASNT